VPVALLTDFGPSSPYVGAMKGVIARLSPDAAILDLAHDIPPQAVGQAGFVLAHSYRFFPEGTVFVCVVDPGVGTDRAVVAAQAGGRTFIAPAGALLADVLMREPATRAFRVTARELFLDEVSSTFHGRDVFAPVGAHVAGGLQLERLGPERPPWELIEGAPAPRPGHGRVRMVDRFGNLVTDAPAPAPASPEVPAAVVIGGHRIAARARTYGEAPADGTPFFYTGSYGTIEVAIRGGSASRALGVARGALIETHPATARGPGLPDGHPAGAPAQSSQEAQSTP
jgi:S-adenosylmethionine hydrolase